VHRFDARLLVSLNMLLFALYCGWVSRYDFFGRDGWFTQPLWVQVLEGFCLGTLFVPLTTLFLSGLTQRRQTQAVELGGMLRVLGGSIASPILSVFWERRAAFHQSRLIESLSLHGGDSGEIIARLHAAGLHGQLATAKLAGIAGQHAAILGLDDTFRLAAWLFLGLASVVWLADPAKPKPAATAKEDSRKAALEELMEEP